MGADGFLWDLCSAVGDCFQKIPGLGGCAGLCCMWIIFSWKDRKYTALRSVPYGTYLGTGSAARDSGMAPKREEKREDSASSLYFSRDDRYIGVLEYIVDRGFLINL